MLKHRRRVLFFLFAGFGFLAASIVFLAHELPRIQLGNRSLSALGSVITVYVRASGEMPRGLADLERKNLLRQADSGQLEAVISGESPITLYHLDEVLVQWAPPFDRLVLDGDVLRDKDTGQQFYILSLRRPYWPGAMKNSEYWSKRLYQEAQNVGMSKNGKGGRNGKDPL